MKLVYVDLLILKHSLQQYIKRDGASDKDINRESNLLKRITAEVTRIEEDYQIKKEKIIKFVPKEDIYWDDWGFKRLVFKEGVKYRGLLHPSGKVTAETPYYTDVSDFVDIEKIELVN
jgi:hypothetical protein